MGHGERWGYWYPVYLEWIKLCVHHDQEHLKRIFWKLHEEEHRKKTLGARDYWKGECQEYQSQVWCNHPWQAWILQSIICWSRGWETQEWLDIDHEIQMQ